MPHPQFSPSLALLLEEAASLDVLAGRQVWAGFCRNAGVLDAALAALLNDPGMDAAFSRLLVAARSLCPLEALVHRTAEVESALAHGRADFAAAESGMPPLPFPVSCRVFAGVAFAQRTWLEEVRYLSVPLGARTALLPESPSWSLESFA